MLFEMLTGNLPFTSQKQSPREAIEEIKGKIKNAPTPLMKQYYPPISADLQLIVDRALAKLPSQRYQTCEEFKQAIVEYMKKDKELRKYI